MDLFCYLCFSLPYCDVCFLQPCGHLFGKEWALGSRLWCLTVSLLLSHWYPGLCVVLDCIDSWSLHPYLLSCMWWFLVFLSLSHSVSWVRCGTGLYRFLIFAFFLTLIGPAVRTHPVSCYGQGQHQGCHGQGKSSGKWKKIQGQGKVRELHFQSGKFKKMKKSHGNVMEFQNFPKKMLVNRLLEILVSIICKQY